MVLEGLQLLLNTHPDINIVQLCNSANSLLTYLKVEQPDVILLDINMPELNGIEACKIIKKEYPSIKIIALSMIAEINLVKLMLKNGAVGYLHKNAGQDEIISAIHDVVNGKRYLSSEINDLLLLAQNNIPKIYNSPFPKLSRREEEILTFILDELTTKEIADKLFISFGTVETHRRNIMIKLGVKNTAGLVRVALEYDIINKDH
jgi:DNA-binding NarL/FixJ family response regulator